MQDKCNWNGIYTVDIELSLKLNTLAKTPRISPDSIFKKLIAETEGLQVVGMEIMDKIKYYKLPC